jgi:hypothetical protein
MIEQDEAAGIADADHPRPLLFTEANHLPAIPPDSHRRL